MNRRAFIALLCGAAAGFAPAPTGRRPPARPEVSPGEWSLTWGTTRWEASLGPSGDWLATRGGSDAYVGWWSYDARRRELTICEWPHAYPSLWRTYRARLDGELSGRTGCGTSVKLERRP